MGVTDWIKHGWDAFLGRDPTGSTSFDGGYFYGSRPDRPRFHGGNERSITTAVYNRIAVDAAAIDIKHVITDENGSFLENKKSALNTCLTIEANLDQTGSSLIRSAVINMLDSGSVAIVPTVTTTFPQNPGAFDVEEMRVAKIVDYRPQTIVVNIYNPHTGKHENREFDKRFVAIIENPFYAVMNESSSTMQRLIKKLALLDHIDEETGAGKLDLIIQLPYVVKTPQRRLQAENRRKDIETQLSGSKYGIAYTDGTERITQLNRPISNTLNEQVEYLTQQLYAQLSITEEIMNGTANAAVMQNYYSRTIEPILSAITDELTRKFLTKTARTQHQAIMFFRDPFELVPVDQLADIADRFTRNAILSSNEVRAIVGYKAVDTPEANALMNKNIKQDGDIPSVEGKGSSSGESNAASSSASSSGSESEAG